MNIIKAQNLLKNAPDETLAQYLARPTGDFPEYLVASEMKRRDDLRKKYAAEQQGQAPKTSVIDDLIRQTGAMAPQPPPPQMPAPPMPPEAMGLGAVPPPPGMQLTPAPMMEAAQQAPQQFNDGGIVALSGGGPVAFKMGGDARYDFDPSSFTSGLPEVQDVPYYFQQQSDLIGPSGTQGYQDALTKQREELEKRKGNYLSDFLIQSGLGMAASKSIHPLQAAAEGALQGFKFYNQAKADDKEVERALLDSEFKFKQAERAEKVGLMGLANQARASAASDRQNAAMLNSRAIELGMRGAELKDEALYRAEDLGYKKSALGAEMKRLQIAERRDAEDAKTRGLEREIKQFELERLKSGKLSPEKQATVIKYISDLKSDLYSNLAYNDKFNKGLEEIKKKYKDPLEQQRAIQMYMRPYFDQVGISDLEAMLP
jgi:hypothetical protein